MLFSQDIWSTNTSKWGQWNIFTTVKILFEFITYFFKYEHFKLDMLFCRTPSILNKHNIVTREVAQVLGNMGAAFEAVKFWQTVLSSDRKRKY